MDSATFTLRDRAARLATAGGEVYDALPLERRQWWEEIAVEAGRMIEDATAEVGEYAEVL